MWTRFISWWNRWRSSDPERAVIGAAGERLAAEFLGKKNGYKIVARNWRSPRDRRDEIDLICRDGEALVFVEVKTRAAGALVSGYHAVGRAKKRVMLRACTAYLRALGATGRLETYRFDVVEVERAANNGGAPIVRHFENVPLFPKDFRL